jgi:hypothetical protein
MGFVNITTKELFENKTDLKHVDEVFRVSTEELMFCMGVQMCHHIEWGSLLDNPNSRLQRLTVVIRREEVKLLRPHTILLWGSRCVSRVNINNWKGQKVCSWLSSSSHLLDVVEDDHVDGHGVVSLAPGKFIDRSVGDDFQDG